VRSEWRIAAQGGSQRRFSIWHKRFRRKASDK